MQQKLYLAFLLVIGMTWQLSAQFVPQGFNYQGIIRDDNGDPLANQTVSLLFAIRSGAPNGPVAYSEKQVLNTNEYGLVNLVVGQGGTPIQGTFTGINWGGSAKYLSVALETSPNVFDDLGTSQLMSVPYALYALSAANGGGGGDDWGAQVVQTSPEFSGNGTVGAPLRMAQQGASNGQVLKWNGSAWVPQDDNGGGTGTVTEVNTGVGLTGGPITTSGTISLSNTGVMPGTYGSAGQIPVITVDAQGRVTTVTTINVQGGGSITLVGGAGIDVQQNGSQYTITNTGDTDPTDDLTGTSQAGGDVNGPFANLQINAGAVNTPELADGAVTGAKIANDAVVADKIAQDAVGASEIAAGAVNTDELADGGVTGAKLNDMGAQVGQVLKWNGTVWQPQADNTGGGGGNTNLTAGPGISVTGNAPDFTITNTGDINPTDDLTNTSQSGGDVTGPFANLQLKPDVVSSIELTDNAVETININNGAVTGQKINPMGANNGQVLKWNGTTWAPAQDQSGTANIVAGVAIDVIDNGNGNYVISNAGDIDPFDDITVNTPAGGDLNGFFNNLQINPLAVTSVEIANNAVQTDKIANGAVTGAKINQMSANPGQVLKWNGTTWAPAQDQAGVGDNWGNQVVVTNATLAGNGATTPLGIAQQGAQPGQVLKWNGASWTPDADLNTGGDDWGAQVAQTDATIDGDGAATPLSIAQQGATAGQVLKWNGTAWIPGDDNDTGGDNWGTQTAATALNIDGDGTAGNPLRLANLGANDGQILKWNTAQNLWLPADDDNSGPDNWGAQVAQTDATIDGDGAATPLSIAQQGATAGQVLKWTGTTWEPGDDNDTGGDDWGAQTAVSALNIAGNGTAGNPLRLANLGANDGQILKWNTAQNLWLPADDDNAGPDDWGTQVAQTDATIDGDGAATPLSIAQQGASAGQVLKWTGTTWEPADDNIGAGPADNWGSQVAITDGTLEGNGTAGNPLSIAQQGANAGQVLKWDGSTWSPADDDNDAANNYSAGFGIDITGSAPNFTIVNTGDNDNSATNELQTLSLAGQDLSLSNGGGTVTLPPSNEYSAGAGIDVTGSAPNFTIVNTGDLSNTNELQTLILAGNDLTLSNGGGTVTLPAGNVYSAGTGINITGSAPNFTIENTGDADADPTNELQTLTLTGTDLSISGGNTVDLSGLGGGGGGFWLANGNDIYNSNTGNVLIGTPVGGSGKLQVEAASGAAAFFNAPGGPALITDNGFVGLNNVSPEVQLHVKGESEIIRAEGAKAAITLSNSGGGFDGYFRINDTLVAVGTTNAVYDVALLPAGRPSLIANANTGHVGIGAPNNGTATLRVKQLGGGLQLENVTGTHNWEFSVDDGVGNLVLFNDQLGPVPAGFFSPFGIYTPSDRRLKHDIKALNTVLDKVMALEPVEFKLNHVRNGDPLIGFVAQDVHALFPELVGKFQDRNGETYQAVNYTGFGVIAVKALQEQQKEIEQLRQENKTMEERMLQLEARLNKLEADNRK